MARGTRAAHRIAAAIAARRERSADPALSQLRDGPFDVLGHVARHNQGVSQADLTTEVHDAVELLNWLREELDRYEAGLFDNAAKCNFSLAQIAQAWHLASRQAAYQHRKYVRRRVADMALSVAASDADEAAAARAAEPAAGDLRDVARQLVVQLQSADLDEVADDRDRIEAHLRCWRGDGPCPPGLLADLTDLVGDLLGRALRGRLAAAVRRAAELLDLDEDAIDLD